jgi:NTP pyrophosphatase (non-canonical NTP hydrolase)
VSERDDNREQAFHTPEANPTVNSPKTVQEQVHEAGHGLDFLLEMQGEIEDLWGRRVDPTDPEAVSQYIRDTILCTTDELHEVLGEVHWKPWKDKRGIKDIENYREEMADVLHFILNLYLAAGLNGRDIVLDYMSKNYANRERRQSEEYRQS